MPHTATTRDQSTAAPPILVVDDDASIRSTVSEILEMEGYDVRVAENGAVALDEIERSQPGLMLLDMRMPVLSGWDVAARLKQQHIDLPIVVMTAAQDAQRWCDEIGGAACVPKPFDLLELLAVVERLYPGNPNE